MRQMRFLHFYLIALMVCTLTQKNIAQETQSQVFYWVSDKTGTSEDFLMKYSLEKQADCPHFITRLGGISMQRGPSAALGNAKRDNSDAWKSIVEYYANGGTAYMAMNSGLMNKSYEFASRDEWKKNWSGDVGLIINAKAAGAKKVVMFMQSPLSKGNTADFNPNIKDETQPNGGATLNMRVADCIEYADYVEANKPDGIEVTYGLIDAFPAKRFLPANDYHKAYVDLVKGFKAKGYVFEEIQFDMKTQTVKASANWLLDACQRAYTEILQQTGEKVRMTWYTWNSTSTTDLEANSFLRTALNNIANHPKRLFMTGLLLDGNRENRNEIVDIIPSDMSQAISLTARVNEAFSILEKIGVMNPTQKGDPILGPGGGGNIDLPKPKPDNLNVTVVSSSSLQLSWVDNIANETGFIIERFSDERSIWEKVDSTMANSTAYLDENLTPFTSYLYRLRAKYDGDTLSAPTDAFLARTTLAEQSILTEDWHGISFGDTLVNTASGSFFLSDTFTIDAGNGDFWAEYDRGHFIYKPFNGDGEIIAQLVDFTDAQSFSMAGLMMRETLAPDSKYAAQFIMSSDGPIMRDRIATAGACNQKTYPKSGEDAPIWIKLARKGDLFTGYISTDAQNWKEIRSITISMSQNIYVGMAACSHTPEQTGLYSFTHVAVDNATATSNVQQALVVDAYPNPANTVLHIKTKKLLGGTIEIFTITGKNVFRSKLTSELQTINVEALTKGIYFVTITQGSTSLTKKIVIE